MRCWASCLKRGRGRWEAWRGGGRAGWGFGGFGREEEGRREGEEKEKRGAERGRMEGGRHKREVKEAGQKVYREKGPHADGEGGGGARYHAWHDMAMDVHGGGGSARSHA